MENLTLEKFRVDMNNPVHREHFTPQENGALYEIVSLRRYYEILVEQGKHEIKFSNLSYAIESNRVHFIEVNNDRLIVLSPKSLAYTKLKKGNQGDRKTIANARYKADPELFKKVVSIRDNRYEAKKNQDFHESLSGKSYVLVDKTTTNWKIVAIVKKANIKEIV